MSFPLPPPSYTSDVDAEYDELENDGDESDGEPGAFKIRKIIQFPARRDMTTKELHSFIHEGSVDLNPPYQRDVVWSEAKQITLINSIFRNIYIPPVIFAVQQDEDGEDVRVCVDGKQRLTSIQKFFDGVIPHRDERTKKSYWYVSPESSRAQRNLVPDYWKEQFDKKIITCVEYTNLGPGLEREIFQRVQLGVSLTAAEKLQAIASPFSEWIGELESKHVLVENGLSQVLNWDIKRGRDFQNIAHLVYCCHGLPEEQQPTASKLEKWLSSPIHPEPQFKERIDSVLNEFWKIATSDRYNQGFKKINQRLAPVEFVFVGVLLYVLRDSSIDTRAKAIYNLRKHVRREHKDVRTNSVVGRTLWDFIGSLQEDPHRYTQWQDTEDEPTGTSSKGKKRSRKSSDNDDDEGGDYRPRSRSGKSNKKR